jgi:nucleoside-diphosphate-sugar epimerase
MKGPVAVTGGTGFIGRRMVGRLVEDDWQVRVLARRRDLSLEQLGVTTVDGSLEDGLALERLVADTVAVVHCAGAITAPSRVVFERINALGVARLVDAAMAAASRPRFLLLSSLAAREPRLSAYAASKRKGEEEARRRAAGSGLDLCVLRPPAVYGPGDRATLPVFRQLRRGLLFTPAVTDARFSLLFVDDLAELVSRLLDTPVWGGCVIEPDDGRVGGYRWTDLAEIAGRQMGRRVRTLAIPWQVLALPAGIAQLAGAAFGRPPRLSLGKLRELFHLDWVCGSSMKLVRGCWNSPTTFESGFARTMAWYEQNQWL